MVLPRRPRTGSATGIASRASWTTQARGYSCQVAQDPEVPGFGPDPSPLGSLGADGAGRFGIDLAGPEPEGSRSPRRIAPAAGIKRYDDIAGIPQVVGPARKVDHRLSHLDAQGGRGLIVRDPHIESWRSTAHNPRARRPRSCRCTPGHTRSRASAPACRDPSGRPRESGPATWSRASFADSSLARGGCGTARGKGRPLGVLDRLHRLRAWFRTSIGGPSTRIASWPPPGPRSSGSGPSSPPGADVSGPGPSGKAPARRRSPPGPGCG